MKKGLLFIIAISLFLLCSCGKTQYSDTKAEGTVDTGSTALYTDISSYAETTETSVYATADTTYGDSSGLTTETTVQSADETTITSAETSETAINTTQSDKETTNSETQTSTSYTNIAVGSTVPLEPGETFHPLDQDHDGWIDIYI